MDPLQTSQKNHHREWLAWLTNERHISPEVIKSSGLYTHKEHLSIPVRDVNGKLLFYKHRRSFKSTEGPKYRYDKGATSALFGAETLKGLAHDACIVVTEGELDALAVRSQGIPAVSSTGGAGTWRVEWWDILAPSNRIIFLYDADKAGVEGALKASAHMPASRIAWLPIQYGKDPTEVIHAGYRMDLIKSIKEARNYPGPLIGNTDYYADLKRLRTVLLAERKERLGDPLGTPFHVDFGLLWVNSQISAAEMEAKKILRRRDNTEFSSDVEKARAYPIRELIKVNRQNKALCLWHTEKDPSLHVYTDHAFCFVCQKRADAIDVYMAINHSDFKTAVKALI